MNNTLLIIGNTIALIASILMVLSGIIKNKKKFIYVQSIQIFLSVISNLVLNGITGAIINFISFIRNVLCYKNKLGLIAKIIITIISIVLCVLFNNLGIIGYLPLISTIIYLWLMNEKDIIKFKYIVIITIGLWIVYDFTIKSYTAAIFDILYVVTNTISVIQIKRRRKK